MLHFSDVGDGWNEIGSKEGGEGYGSLPPHTISPSSSVLFRWATSARIDDSDCPDWLEQPSAMSSICSSPTVAMASASRRQPNDADTYEVVLQQETLRP